MIPAGRHTDKVSYTTDGEIVVDDIYIEQHVLLDDWVMVKSKWVRVTKVRFQSTNTLHYYEDGVLAHSMPYPEMNQLHKDKSKAKPLKLKDMVEPAHTP